MLSFAPGPIVDLYSILVEIIGKRLLKSKLSVHVFIVLFTINEVNFNFNYNIEHRRTLIYEVVLTNLNNLYLGYNDF